MAVTGIFEHIGAKLKIANPWLDTYSVNCIQLPDKKNGAKGEIVNFIGEEKSYKGIDDSCGTAFYIKINPKFTYTPQRQLTSCEPGFEVSVPFKFVFFAVNQDKDYNPLTIENIFSNCLRQMNFNDYLGIERKIKLIILNSNTDGFQVFFDELGKKYSFSANSICISIDCQLKFLSTKDCEEECGVSTAGNILSGIDFCEEKNVNLLSVTQKDCLKDALCETESGFVTVVDGYSEKEIPAGETYVCENHGGGCQDATIKNSDNTYNDNVASGSTLNLPDEVFNFYLDGVLVDTETEPALSTQTFNINWN